MADGPQHIRTPTPARRPPPQPTPRAVHLRPPPRAILLHSPPRAPSTSTAHPARRPPPPTTSAPPWRAVVARAPHPRALARPIPARGHRQGFPPPRATISIAAPAAIPPRSPSELLHSLHFDEDKCGRDVSTLFFPFFLPRLLSPSSLPADLPAGTRFSALGFFPAVVFSAAGFSSEEPSTDNNMTPKLTTQDYSRLSSSVIAHELQLKNGETRWVVDTIVGKEDGLGCENLHGSGAIASAYSKAYKETFTLTFVTGRAVGIGAYLARLGMRCIQRLDQPIILTGFSALNKLLGREVYSSHMQLGGPKIMATNGVVHQTVSDDLEGVSAILKWLSYVPPYVGGPLPIMKPLDPPERPVTYLPENACDALAAICGIQDGEGRWLGGMFDRESFVETLEGWAKTVITGRAKLGGIPVGVIAVETQTVMQVIPADPGQLDSAERVVPQAGQVSQ
ncbi:acetyl-CoA carboxylase 1 [Zea mays]|uniref:acetyl-CoA carboxylase 1 n=1 Tax=Zea mays TaxID=4577 RepID=UPI0004DEAFB1|nr:acetyl-CoA carboxylase 1-like [Zea mays]|eukprot:XP_008680608.1 acetyl-CoA carboxylase 1-like [Zea mays]